MILVTLGTQKQQFTRLLDYIEKSDIKDKIVVQSGHTKYESKKMEIIPFINYDEMEQLVNDADIIITHGGTGSIIGPLKKGKKIISCARLKRYGEHVDDHQEQLVDIFSDEGYLLKLNENNDLNKLLKSINKFNPKHYESNTNNFQGRLEAEIIKPRKKNKFTQFVHRYQYIFYFFISFGILDFFSRFFCRTGTDISIKDLSPNLFTIAWISLFISILYLIPYKLKKGYLFILILIFNLLFFVDAIYFNIFGGFPSFGNLSLTSEASGYILDVLSFIGIKTILISLSSIIIGILCIKTIPFSKSKTDRFIMLILLLLAVGSYSYASYNIGPEPAATKWDNWDNRRYIFNSHNNTKKAYMLSGLYNYFIRDFYITFLEKSSVDKKQLISDVDSYIKNNPKVHDTNYYSGLFKDKNLIFVMMETIEDWMITEDNMPTLYKLMSQSINFKNHYSVNYVPGHTFNTEFVANTGLIPSGDSNQLTKAYNKNYFSQSLPKLFRDEGYTVNSYHKNAGSFYDRESVHINLGYQKYYDSGSMNMSRGYSNFDSYMIKDGYKKIVSDNKFMSFIITYSAHMPYRDSKVECKNNLEYVKKYLTDTNNEYLCAMAQAHETDNFFEELIKKLKDDNKLDNTVIIGFTDHYAYGIDKKLLYGLKKQSDSNLLQQTPFFIWSNNIKPVEIKSLTSTIEILPTVANLFDLKWNPNYYPGNDALNPNNINFVFFKDRSWYDGKNYYKFGSKNNNINSQIINTNNKKIADVYQFSQNILVSDYFRFRK